MINVIEPTCINKFRPFLENEVLISCYRHHVFDFTDF